MEFYCKVSLLQIQLLATTGNYNTATDELLSLLNITHDENIISLYIEFNKHTIDLLVALKKNSDNLAQDTVEHIDNILNGYNNYHKFQNIYKQRRKTKTDDKLMSHLSTKELEIVKLVAKGKSNKEIAELQHIAVTTLKTYLTKIFKKLNVKNRKEIIVNYSKLKIYY